MEESSNEWTVMVYMAGDSSLTTDLVYALEELKQVARDRNNKLDIYAYFDGISPDVPTLYCDFNNQCDDKEKNDCQPSFLQSWKAPKLIKVDRDYNENSAAINSVLNFVNWCVKHDSEAEIKRKNYAFIFSGHSFGFLNWGLFRDEKADYYMTHRKLRYMFERMTASKEELAVTAKSDEEEHRVRTGDEWKNSYRKERKTPIIGKKLAFLGFDSCVMSTLEIGSQFRRFAETMVASEGSIPTAGWNYATILGNVINDFAKTSVPPSKMAVQFVERFIGQQRKFALADISVDISAWDFTRMNDLEQRFGKFVDALANSIDKSGAGVRRQLQRAITYSHWRCQTYMFEQHIDLADFCGELITELELIKYDVGAGDIRRIVKLRDECKLLIAAIRDCILLTGFSGGDFQFSNGISLFFPWSLASYAVAQNDYEDLNFISETYAGRRWNEFLHSFLCDLTFRNPAKLSKPNAWGIFKNPTASFESYTFKNRGPESDENSWHGFSLGGSGGGVGHRQPPNGTRQPPNGTRQPPNGTRQPPNDPRRMDEMSLFLGRFLRLKNFRFDWNRVGFTSERVKFRSPVSRPPDGELSVVIPDARPISKRFEKIFAPIESNKALCKEQKDVYQSMLALILHSAPDEMAESVADTLGTFLKDFNGDPKELLQTFKDVAKDKKVFFEKSKKGRKVLLELKGLVVSAVKKPTK